MGEPKTSGYAEATPRAGLAQDKPNPDAAGNEAAQVAATLPAEEDDTPDDVEPAPPGENKREPIKDPDPADTKMHVQQGSR